MKYFIVVFCVFVGVQVYGYTISEVKEMQRKCGDEGNRCYYACLAENLDIMVDGKLNATVEIDIFKSFGQPVNETKIDDCIKKANLLAERCEVALTAHKCVHDVKD